MRYQAADFGFFDDREAKYSRLILILAWSLNGRDHQPSRALANIIARFAHGGVMIRDRPDQDSDNVLDIWTWMLWRLNEQIDERASPY